MNASDFAKHILETTRLQAEWLDTWGKDPDLTHEELDEMVQQDRQQETGELDFEPGGEE